MPWVGPMKRDGCQMIPVPSGNDRGLARARFHPTAKVRGFSRSLQIKFPSLMRTVGQALLLRHSEDIDLSAVKPVLQLFVCWLCVVLARQVKMQKNIVNLV